MIAISLGSAGVVLGGPLLGLALGVGWVAWERRPQRQRTPAFRPILLMLLVELRAGLSVLAALNAVAGRFPDHGDLVAAVRLASVIGLERAVDMTSDQTRVLMTHLARANASGGSAADAVRRMLDSDITREKATRLARTRALPVRLMLPVTLLLLPGVVLMSYGPTLFSLLDDLAIPFG